MNTGNKISPFIALFICLNTMIGAGLFINPAPLTALAGPLGFLGYFFAACVMMPIIYCTAELASLHPVSGGIYVFAKSYLGPIFGFFSCWSYFLGKTTTSALLAHKFIQFLQAEVPAIANIPTLLCDYLLITTIITLNIGGLLIGGKAQYFFTSMRLIPFIGTFLVGFTIFNSNNFHATISNACNIYSTLPIAVFAFLGFEIICAIGHMIKDSEKNIKKVILSSFSIVAAISIFFQLILYGALGNDLANTKFPIERLFEVGLPSHHFLGGIFSGMVFVAILGSCFAILTSNCWNLFTLAKNDHLPFKSILTRISSSNVPFGSLIIEGLICCTFLSVTTDQISLQNIAVFAQVLSFFFTTTATLQAKRLYHATQISIIFPILGIISSLFVLALSLTRIIASGVSFSFASIFLLGIGSMIFIRYRNNI